MILEIKNGDRVLIPVSGGGNSSSLLNLIRTTADKQKTKRYSLLHPTLLYIDDSAIYGTDFE